MFGVSFSLCVLSSYFTNCFFSPVCPSLTSVPKRARVVRGETSSIKCNEEARQRAGALLVPTQAD